MELPLLETDADKSAMERVRKPEPDLKPIGVWNTRDPRNQPEKANRLNQVDCFPRIYIYIILQLFVLLLYLYSFSMATPGLVKAIYSIRAYESTCSCL